MDPLLDLFQGLGCSRDEDDMRAGGGQRLGSRRADSSAGAGDECEFPREGLAVGYRVAPNGRR